MAGRGQLAFRTEHLAEGVTLYCGDGPVGAVVSDPPYGMEFRSNYRAVRHDAIANDAEEWAANRRSRAIKQGEGEPS